MRVALVTTPEATPSGIGDYTQTLGAHLAERVEVVPYLPAGTEGAGWCGLEARPVTALGPRSADRILYQVGNERAHAFMLEPLRRVGGTVTLHDWILFDLATSAFPELERGGWRGHLAAWRCGGLDQRRRWYDAIRARREGVSSEARAAGGPLLHGWHEPERDGRWCAPRAGIATRPGASVLELDLHLPAGHRLQLEAAGSVAARVDGPHDGLVRADLPDAATAVALSVRGARAVEGDPRPLGAFIRSVRLGGAPLDLTAPAALPVAGPQLSDARFELSFQRPIVRWADAFLVHSAAVADRIHEDRNAATAIGRVPHGVDPTPPAPGVRAEARRAVGWEEPGTVLIVSFGAIQEHKRPEPLLRAFAAARARDPRLRLVLAGAPRTERLDLEGLLAELGLEESVRITGWLEEDEAVRWMEASDFCVHLRGPSTMGTSGGAARALGAGRALVLSDLPEWREFPEGAVRRIPVGGDEVEALAAALNELGMDEGVRASMEGEALRWAAEEAAWPVVADRTVELLERMPAHRTARRSLLQTLNKEAQRNVALRAEREKRG